MKILINDSYGGFGFSKEFEEFYPPAKEVWGFQERDDPILIQAVEEFGLEKASGDFAELEIVEIPDNATDWEINEYDGMENVVAVVDGKLRHY